MGKNPDNPDAKAVSPELPPADGAQEETLFKTPESDTARQAEGHNRQAEGHNRQAELPTLDKTPQSDAEHPSPLAPGDAPQVDEAHRDTAAPSGQTDTMGFSELFSVAGTGAGGAGATTDRAAAPQHLGDYELLQRLGEGGMGVVYLARQRSADRIVALKVIRSDRLTGDHQVVIERFQTEARAAAKLDHDHIVTIFEVGQSEGQHFFSMRLVNGRSVADLLRERPLENRRAAAYLHGMACGIAHAHHCGILHRDLKPQNVLIDDASDRALITDFGLAKFVEGDTELTRHGEVMGTPSYMSPEQARDAGRVTTAADIYALGATLYHMLTGRPPFQAATPLATLKLVTDQDPPKPRTLNPEIDKDLETICLKCLEKHPSARYESADEVAAELERFLDGRPIVARPLGTLPKIARKCRRHPAMASLIFATLTAVVAMIGALGYGYLAAVAAEKKSSATAEMAFGVVNNLYTKFSEETLLDQPGMRPFRRQLLQESQTFYRELIQHRSKDPRMQVEVALAHFRIGWITEQLESPEQALTHYEAALEEQRGLLAKWEKLGVRMPPQSRHTKSDLQRQLSDTYNAIGVAQHQLGRREPSRQSYTKAIEIRRELPAADVDGRRKLANSLMNLGLLDADEGDVAPAIGRFGEAQTIRAQLAQPENLRLQRDLAKGYYNWFQLLASQAPEQPPTQLLDQAIAKLEAVRKAAPLDQEVQYLLAICYRLQGDLQTEIDGAASRYYQAKNLLHALATQNPDVADYQQQLARVLILIAKGQFEQQEDAASLATLDEAIRRLEKLVARDDALPQWHEDLTIAKTARDVIASRQ